MHPTEEKMNYSSPTSEGHLSAKAFYKFSFYTALISYENCFQVSPLSQSYPINRIETKSNSLKTLKKILQILCIGLVHYLNAVTCPFWHILQCPYWMDFSGMVRQFNVVDCAAIVR